MSNQIRNPKSETATEPGVRRSVFGNYQSAPVAASRESAADISPVETDLLSMGSAGDPPAPSSDSLDGTGVRASTTQRSVFQPTPCAIPSGESPDGTGESPVLPRLNKDERERRGQGPGTVRNPESLQSSIDSAIARSFFYRFIAKAFEDPEREGWQSLCQAELQAAFGSAARAVAEGAPPNLESAAGKLFHNLKPDGYTAFESEYITCFGHTVRGDCPMNEIEYGDIKADPLFQPHRLADLGAFYAAFGVEVGPDAAERQDHISIELEFMSVLAAKEAYALEHQFDDEAVALLRDAQKKFLREHLGRWTPAFTRRLSRTAGDGVLSALADFTREFINSDCGRFDVTPGSEDLLLRPIDDSLETLCASCGIVNPPPGAMATLAETSGVGEGLKP